MHEGHSILESGRKNDRSRAGERIAAGPAEALKASWFVWFWGLARNINARGFMLQ